MFHSKHGCDLEKRKVWGWGANKLSMTTKSHLGGVRVAISLVLGYILFELFQYYGLPFRYLSNHFTATIAPLSETRPEWRQLPNDSFIASGVRGDNQPLESTPDDPHLCILVSTYKRHSAKLIPLLTSFFVTEYPHIKAILLDTDGSVDSMPCLKDVAKVVNGIFEKEYVVTANITQRDVLKKYTQEVTGVVSDYGYILTDLIIHDILKKRELAKESNDTKPECDFLLTTNGDNLYGPDIVPALLYYMKKGYDMTGFDFISHYITNNWWPVCFPERVFKTGRRHQQVVLEPVQKSKPILSYYCIARNVFKFRGIIMNHI